MGMKMKMKMINKAAAHFGNPSFFTLFRSYSAHLSITKLIQTRCKSGTLKLDEAVGFFHSLIRTRPMPSVSAFNQLIGALSKLNHYSAAVYMFREMMRCVDFGPDVRTMTVVMNCYCRLNNVDLAFSALAITLKRGLQPDAYTFNTLLHGLCRQRESMDDAVELFRRIVGRGDPCDHITYATIIGALCKTHNTLKAIEILIEMQEIGNIKPSVNCFNPIIDSLFKEEKICEAISLFELMTWNGIKPDVVTFTSLISSLCKSGQLKKAVQFLSNMNECGTLPDVVTYSTILDALCKEGRTVEARNLLEAMSDNNVKPDIVTYTSIICGFCHAGQWKEVTRLLDKMKDQGVLPDVVTFSTMVNALCRERRIKVALGLLDLMIQRDLKPDFIIYRSLLYALCNLSLWEEATRLLKVMVSQEVFPDTMTLNMVLDALAKIEITGKPQKTFEVVIEYLKTLATT